jgi:hypothetical protein
MFVSGLCVRLEASPSFGCVRICLAFCTFQKLLVIVAEGLFRSVRTVFLTWQLATRYGFHDFVHFVFPTVATVSP